MQQQWTLHTSLPDMREVQNSKFTFNSKLECEKKLSGKYLIKSNGLEYTPDRSECTIVLAKGDFYHFKKAQGKKKSTYFINLSLVEDVVGSKEHDIYGYVCELLAYSFFDRNIRKSLKLNNKKNKLFKLNDKSYIQDTKTLEQFCSYYK